VSRRATSRRYRVVARPQTRARRVRTAAAVVAVLILGGLAAASARHAASALSRARLSMPIASSMRGVSVEGVAEPFLSLTQAVVDAAPGSAGEKAEVLKARFPCVSDVSVRRPWGEQRATLTPVLRRAVAPVLRRGRAAGYLGDDGAVFGAPAGVFSFSGPAVDVAGAEAKELKILAREWPALCEVGALPAPLAVLSYRSTEDGWEARLEDGTTVLWGHLDWTKEKLARLSEAMIDARAKEPGALAADLRYFADGKVLLKPISLKPLGQIAAAGTRGGAR